MSLTNDEITAKNFKEFYRKILPYLGGNMIMSTNNSDYYSTDEKIVGVWTDGRPLYQKTWTGTVSFNSGSDYDLITSLPANIDDNYSWVDDSASFICQYPTVPVNSGTRQSGFTYSTSYIQMWLGNATTIKFRCDNMGSGTNVPYVCTLKYTKTTDAAGSAATTPGAYNINFPNTWPENTEIYFGNGLYGIRQVRTSASAADTQYPIITGVKKIISYGGTVWRSSDGYGHPIGTNPETSSYPYLYIQGTTMTSGTGTLSMWSTKTTVRGWDVWVTYTK